MRSAFSWAAVALVLAVVALLAVPDVVTTLAHHAGHVGVYVVAMAPPLILPMDIRTAAYQVLQQKTKPVDVNLPEAIPDVLYDTQTYLAAGSGPLDYFVNINADKSLSNMEQGGTLPAPQYFDIWRIFVNFLAPPSATVADTQAGVANDVELILKSARARLTFKQKGKDIGPIPLTFFGTEGGLTAGFDTGRAAAAGAIIQQVGGIFNGGFPINGSVTLRSQSNFHVLMEFSAANVAISANMAIRVSLFGIRYREVG